MRVSKPASAVTALFAAILIATPGPATASGPAATSCPARWALLPASSLPAGPLMGSAQSLSMLSSRDAWISAFGPIGSQLVLHWNGSSIGSPAQVPEFPLALANWAFSQFGGPGSFDSDTDGWVLATPTIFAFNGVASIGTAEHWHGGRWTMTPLAVSPQPGTEGVKPNAVAALSPSSAWAVGGFYAAGPGIPAGTSPIGALVEHWDGTSWDIVPNPASAQPSATLNGLTVVSSADIWAVGYQAGSGSDSIVPLVEHWDGTRWSVIRVPAGNQRSGLFAVSAAGGQVWAAGDQTEQGTADTAVPLIEHWDGTAWTVQHLPDVGNSKLLAIYTASPDDVWAGGMFPPFAGIRDVLLHWDGHAWSTVPVPGPGEYGRTYEVLAISGTGPGDVWMAGLAADVDSVEYTLLAHLSCR